MSLTFFKKNFKVLLPNKIYLSIQKLILIIRLILYKAPNFYCCICEKEVDGTLVGMFPSLSLACSQCFSLSRQRVLAEYLSNLSISKSVILHFAPEDCIREKILDFGSKKYICCDLEKNKYAETEVVNIEDINFDDNTFDYIIALHVLEHVDDGQAL